GDVIRFDNQQLGRGRAERMLSFDDDVDSLAFGAAGSPLDGLLFVSHNDGPHHHGASQLTMVDLAALQQVAVAAGGSRGENIVTTADGRVLLSQSHQIDILMPLSAPHIVAVSPPPDSVAALPLGQISIAFSTDMLQTSASDAGSVLNPTNYDLVGDTSGPVVIRAVAYDKATRTALVNFDGLTAEHYTLRVLHTVRSA